MTIEIPKIFDCFNISYFYQRFYIVCISNVIIWVMERKSELIFQLKRLLLFRWRRRLNYWIIFVFLLVVYAKDIFDIIKNVSCIWSLLSPDRGVLLSFICHLCSSFLLFFFALSNLILCEIMNFRLNNNFPFKFNESLLATFI